MTGRHALRGRRRRRWPAWLAALLVTLGAVAVGGYFVRDMLPIEGTAEATCEGSLTVSLAAAPSIAPTLAEIVADLVVDEGEEAAPLAIDGTCVTAEVTAAPSAEVVDTLSAESSPDLWVPESSMWTQRVSTGGVALGGATSIATSPLVVVVPQPVAQQHLGWPDAEFSWTAVLDSEATATIADPMTTAEGLATLLAVQSSLGDTDPTQLVQAMTAVSQAAVPDVTVAYDSVRADPAAAPLFTAAEQSVVAHNQLHPESPVVALYPAEGTLAFDYPAIPIETSATTPAMVQAVRSVIEVLQSDRAVAALQAAGFRSPDGAARDSAGIVDGIQSRMPTAMPSPDPQAATVALRQWAALSIDMRMLTVIDVSGSMWFTDDSDVTRVELVRDAALVALNLLPQTGEVGVWWFSTEEDPPNHWREVVPIRPLHEEVDGRTQLEILVEATHALPDSAVRGWTALYDTTWAAFQAVKENYDPNKINSVVLMTDGTDERAPEMAPGMDRETLLSQLRAQHDPARPVPIITIGIGPDADMEALQEISEATGTTAYLALDPADIQQVFLQAMVERQCRPNC
jgi:Ca-activated chloride channel homolog